MEIITLVEEYSFLHPLYIDLFSIDQYAHSPFSFILIHANLPFYTS